MTTLLRCLSCSFSCGANKMRTPPISGCGDLLEEGIHNLAHVLGLIRHVR